MPRYKGSCGCYNRDDARTIGLVPAIVWNDLLDRSEQLDSNPMWYDQTEAADRLGMSATSLKRAVDKLVEDGRITKKKGYRPGTTVSTTWITIAENTNIWTSRKSDLTLPRKSDLALPILKETNINKQKGAGLPKNEKKETDKAEYGNPQVNEILALWDDEVGIPAKRDQATRRAAWTLIQKQGIEGARSVLKLIGRSIREGDRYAPQIASLRDLWGKYGKLDKLLVWAKRNEAQIETEPTPPYHLNNDTPDVPEISDEEREKVLKMFKEKRGELFGGVK